MKVLAVCFLLICATNVMASNHDIHCIDDGSTTTNGPVIRDIR